MEAEKDRLFTIEDTAGTAETKKTVRERAAGLRGLLPHIVMTGITAWCLTCTFCIIFSRFQFTQLEFLRERSLGVFLCVLALCFFLVARLAVKTPALPFLSVGSAFAYLLLCVIERNDFSFYIGTSAVLAGLLYYVQNVKGKQERTIVVPRTAAITGFCCLAVFFMVFAGGLTTLRYLTYHSPSFDFGIFSQMFYSMKTTGLPITTCERGMALSHFAVHISPVYYLMLPFYMIVTSPITLQVLQALILAAGLIPLYLLGKHYKLSNAEILLFGVCYIFYPALAGGCFYDLHENKFLTVFILFFFYMMEKRSMKGMLLFAALILSVKEDAPVYLAFIGLYMAVSASCRGGVEKSDRETRKFYRKSGLFFAALSAAYFLLALWLLKTFGEGAMTDRYANYAFEEGGLIDVVKAALLDPAFVLSESMTPEKLEFALKMLLPLAFLPLLSKNASGLILIGPFVLINLMSDYKYQHSIDFQYTYGVTAIFFYLAIKNSVSLKGKLRAFVPIYAAMASVLLFCTVHAGKTWYITEYIEQYSVNQEIGGVLASIPKEASVTSSSPFVAHLYEHKELYKYDDAADTDYVVIDLRGGAELPQEDWTSGYETVVYKEGMIAVYKALG